MLRISAARGRAPYTSADLDGKAVNGSMIEAEAEAEAERGKSACELLRRDLLGVPVEREHSAHVQARRTFEGKKRNGQNNCHHAAWSVPVSPRPRRACCGSPRPTGSSPYADAGTGRVQRALGDAIPASRGWISASRLRAATPMSATIAICAGSCACACCLDLIIDRLTN
jgi:hypothetical protein